jgi:hypothetical protein
VDDSHSRDFISKSASSASGASFEDDDEEGLRIPSKLNFMSIYKWIIHDHQSSDFNSLKATDDHQSGKSKFLKRILWICAQLIVKAAIGGLASGLAVLYLNSARLDRYAFCALMPRTMLFMSKAD